jgi:hypothetical protein
VILPVSVEALKAHPWIWEEDAESGFKSLPGGGPIHEIQSLHVRRDPFMEELLFVVYAFIRVEV